MFSLDTVQFKVYFDITSPFSSHPREENNFYNQYPFDEGDKFCIIPPDYLNDKTIDLSKDKYYIKCVPNKTSFCDLMMIALGRLYDDYHWMIDEMKNDIYGRFNRYFNGKFERNNNGIWYYDCDNK